MYGSNLRQLGLQLTSCKSTISFGRVFYCWREIVTGRKRRRPFDKHLHVIQDRHDNACLLRVAWHSWLSLAAEERLWREHFVPVVRQMQRAFQDTVKTVISKSDARCMQAAFKAWISCIMTAAQLGALSSSAARRQDASLRIMERSVGAMIAEGISSRARVLFHAWWRVFFLSNGGRRKNEVLERCMARWIVKDGGLLFIRAWWRLVLSRSKEKALRQQALVIYSQALAAWLGGDRDSNVRVLLHTWLRLASGSRRETVRRRSLQIVKQKVLAWFVDSGASLLQCVLNLWRRLLCYSRQTSWRAGSIAILDCATRIWFEEDCVATLRSFLHSWWSCTCRDRVLALVAMIEERTIILMPLYRWLQSIIQKWHGMASMHRLPRRVYFLVDRVLEVRREQMLGKIMIAWSREILPTSPGSANSAFSPLAPSLASASQLDCTASQQDCSTAVTMSASWTGTATDEIPVTTPPSRTLR